MKLGAPFYHGLDGKILKICVAWPWGDFLYLNKLRNRLSSWKISIIEVN